MLLFPHVFFENSLALEHIVTKQAMQTVKTHEINVIVEYNSIQEIIWYSAISLLSCFKHYLKKAINVCLVSVNAYFTKNFLMNVTKLYLQ
jgi:hypothetical protein